MPLSEKAPIHNKDDVIELDTLPRALERSTVEDQSVRGSSIVLDDSKIGDQFESAIVRCKFVRKVYMILGVQMWFMTIMIIPFRCSSQLQEFVYDYPWLVYICVALFFIPYVMFVVCESTRHSFPTNTILLFIMTLGIAGICGFITARANTAFILYLMLLLTVVTVSKTILSIFCHFELISCQMVMGGTLAMAAGFCVAAPFIIMVTSNPVTPLLYAMVCVSLMAVFLMFDLQAIMNGRRVEITPRESVLATIQLYVDIVEIFLNFLETIGACTDQD